MLALFVRARFRNPQTPLEKPSLPGDNHGTSVRIKVGGPTYPSRDLLFNRELARRWLINGARESLILDFREKWADSSTAQTLHPTQASDPIRGGTETNRKNARNSLNSLQACDSS
jgi:hypothetical protein